MYMSCVNSLIQLENVYLYILLSGFPSAIGTSVIATIMVRKVSRTKEHL